MIDTSKDSAKEALLNGQNQFSTRINQLSLEGKLNADDQKRAIFLQGELMKVNSEATMFLSKFANTPQSSTETYRSVAPFEQTDDDGNCIFKRP